MHNALPDKAFRLAARLHSRQKRKGTDIPYLSHLQAVAAIVVEHGGTAAQVAAAFLHDAIEDQGHQITAAEIEADFGAEVAGIVLACTDAMVQPKRPWKERKVAYLAHLPETPEEALLVSCADKLHNAQSILDEYKDEKVGESVFERFNASKEEVLWYYRELAAIFADRVPEPLGRKLEQTVAELEQLASPAIGPP
jgi:(p)ppGpp synthase/HD superfamily hydrolase